MFKKFTMAAAGLSLAATAVFAASHAGGPFDAAIGARQSHMKLYAHNLGILGGMAKGAMEYDAAAASAAAGNLAALAAMNQMTYWPPGSDSFDNENTDALPAIWDNFADVAEKGAALAAATQAMAGVAGNGLEAVQGAIGNIGQACGGCHKKYRKPKDG